MEDFLKGFLDILADHTSKTWRIRWIIWDEVITVHLNVAQIAIHAQMIISSHNNTHLKTNGESYSTASICYAAVLCELKLPLIYHSIGEGKPLEISSSPVTTIPNIPPTFSTMRRRRRWLSNPPYREGSRVKFWEFMQNPALTRRRFVVPLHLLPKALPCVSCGGKFWNCIPGRIHSILKCAGYGSI